MLLTGSIVLTITAIINTLAIIGMTMTLVKYYRQTEHYLELLQKTMEQLATTFERYIWRS